MEWMLMPLRRYADFSGRSRRKEYWMFVLLQLIIYAVVGLIATMMVGADSATGDGALGIFSGVGLILFVIVILALFIPTLAVTVRRFHDQDKSGWFILLNFIPYIGGIIVLVFMCLEGTKGPNRFGDDPKGETNAQIFA